MGASTRGTEAARNFNAAPMVRRLLLTLPGVAVLVVAGAWFWLRADDNLVGARLFVGPYPGQRLALRAWVGSAASGQAAPVAVPLRLVVRTAGAFDEGALAYETEGVSDAVGVAEFNVDLPFVPGAHLDLELYARSAQGAAAAPLCAVRWARDASAEVALTRRGGWVEGKQTGALRIEFGVDDGVLAVPFPAPASVRVTEDGRFLASVPLQVELDGAHLLDDAPLVTDAFGTAHFSVVPDAHHVEVSLSAAAGSSSGQYWGTVPVVPGAMKVELAGANLRVLSAVPRERAYVNLVAESGILQVAGTELREHGAFFVGELPVSLPRGESWAVVSSELDAQSQALVGWPLASGSAVSQTYDLRMRLLADGLVQARLRQKTAHARLRRGVGQFLFAVFVIEGGLLFLQVRRKSSAPSSELNQVLERTLVSGARGWLWVGIGLVALGFVALGLFLFLAEH